MIIVRSVNTIQHGHGSIRSPYELFADTKAEVPETGTATKALISGFTGSIPPSTVLITADWNIAQLGTDDKWGWLDM